MTAESADQTPLAHPGETADDEWLPDHCPKWCDGHHRDALLAGNGWRNSQQHVRSGPEGVLEELRNPIDKRVTRPGGASYDLKIRQRPTQRGYLDVEQICLDARDGGDVLTPVRLPLTSGEARTLARQLLALADKVDL